MTDTSTTRVEASDAMLIAAVRGGDTQAYAELFDRHRAAATRLAEQLVRGPDADDLVAEAFVRVLAQLQAGKGPDEFFRAYLLTSIRRLHIDRGRRMQRVRSTGDETELDRAVEFVDTAEMRFEQGAAAAAFATLPERWQLVLWHLDVEGHKPAQVAPLLGMSPNSVSALAYRAREGLRQAYLQSHLAPSLHASCRRTTGMLGSYVRRGLSKRDAARVEEHLDDCSRCTGLYLELSEVNANLSGLLGPALLGAAAAGYATSGAAATGVGALVEAALAPVKAAGNVVAGAGTQGVVAATAVVAVGAAGALVATDAFGPAAQDDPPVAAPRTPGPEPTTEPTEPRPTATTRTPEPTPTVTTPEPTPTPEATLEPPDPEPTPEPTVEPVVDPEPEPAPEPKAEAIAPTDYSIASVRVTNQLLPLLQRRIAVEIGAANPGRAAAQTVTLTLAFDRPVHVDDVTTPGWQCREPLPHRRLRTLTCSSELAAGAGATFGARARNLLSAGGTITVSADGDPVPGNDAASFRAGLWPLG